MNEWETRCSDQRESTGGYLSTWGISVLFHVLLLLLLSLAFSDASVSGVKTDRTAEVGIALKSYDGEKMLYESAEDSGQGEDTSKAAPSERDAEAASLKELESLTASREAPEIPTVSREAPGLAPREGSGKTEGLDRVTAGLETAGPLGGGAFSGFGRGKVSCFNTTGEGNRFSYVFDRSGSMGGPGFSPIMAAKAELLRSLRSLQPNQQFQIIFYNELPLIFSNKMLLATEGNRRKAINFLGTVTADGGTGHKEALHAAIAQRPDVIFFLTDADEPPLTPFELKEIRKNAAGIQINTIQFGIGSEPRAFHFLKQLARDNGGQYIYIDIQKLAEE
ncbi:MAG: hypothetical protein Q4D98_14145 [Planctomycetia bacterium]|nr:hypothetical protein [Planctomycetia bacterium]